METQIFWSRSLRRVLDRAAKCQQQRQSCRRTPRQYRRCYATKRVKKSASVKEDGESGLPTNGLPVPMPKPFPNASYPFVAKHLTASLNDSENDKSRLWFYESPVSTSGRSTVLGGAIFVSNIQGPYPIINWQHWIRNDVKTADGASGLQFEGGKKIPRLLKYTDLVQHFLEVRRIRRSVNERVNLPFLFQDIVRSVNSTDAYFNPTRKIGRKLEDMLRSKERNDHEAVETLDVYIPDAEELSRAEFQFFRRNSSPFLIPGASSLFFLAPIARFLLPRLVASFELGKDVASHTTRWERSIQLAREAFASAYSTPTEDTFRQTSPQLSTKELVVAAKAFGLLPSWVPSFMMIRALMIEKLSNHIAYLKADNILIGKWGGVWSMTEEELDWALLERGAPITGLTLDQKRAQLYIIVVCMTDLHYEIPYLMADNSLSGQEADRIIGMRKLLGFDAKAL
ncbi:hypothetical protein POJ06DRAFT_262601 [Lipomyces tetrasporus]|uniref:Uncharacterized protein n=1 Tax=Lipomyces tetrasporus TaxID=54092 RepID=A0AAD7QKU9_9ASCO|nr:uncharacterized protein POJ06DRAFT_262601 [Lipomyces tetrasporus]KAJ8097130.1 hypothetical protein POJ06DRAFT_262601 [Lipomyces tetrasporus]